MVSTLSSDDGWMGTAPTLTANFCIQLMADLRIVLVGVFKIFWSDRIWPFFLVEWCWGVVGVVGGSGGGRPQSRRGFTRQPESPNVHI